MNTKIHGVYSEIYFSERNIDIVVVKVLECNENKWHMSKLET